MYREKYGCNDWIQWTISSPPPTGGGNLELYPPTNREYSESSERNEVESWGTIKVSDLAIWANWTTETRIPLPITARPRGGW